MMIKKIAILSLALLLPLTIEAQKKKKRVVKKPVVEVVEEPQEDPRITNMREMTQQIIIIDSIVTLPVLLRDRQSDNHQPILRETPWRLCLPQRDGQQGVLQQT